MGWLNAFGGAVGGLAKGAASGAMSGGPKSLADLVAGGHGLGGGWKDAATQARQAQYDQFVQANPGVNPLARFGNMGNQLWGKIQAQYGQPQQAIAPAMPVGVAPQVPMQPMGVAPQVPQPPMGVAPPVAPTPQTSSLAAFLQQRTAKRSASQPLPSSYGMGRML